MPIAPSQARKPICARVLKALIVAVAAVFVAAGAAESSRAAGSAPSPGKPVTNTQGTRPSDAMPTFKLVVGAKGSPDPYTPRVLNIPADRKVALDVTDNIGGCALVTIFPNLGPDGATVRASVPVGQMRRVVLLAAKPGRYRYHCSENMFFGEIVAR